MCHWDQNSPQNASPFRFFIHKSRGSEADAEIELDSVMDVVLVAVDRIVASWATMHFRGLTDLTGQPAACSAN